MGNRRLTKEKKKMDPKEKSLCLSGILWFLQSKNNFKGFLNLTTLASFENQVKNKLC